MSSLHHQCFHYIPLTKTYRLYKYILPLLRCWFRSMYIDWLMNRIQNQCNFDQTSSLSHTLDNSWLMLSMDFQMLYHYHNLCMLLNNLQNRKKRINSETLFMMFLTDRFFIAITVLIHLWFSLHVSKQILLWYRKGFKNITRNYNTCTSFN